MSNITMVMISAILVKYRLFQCTVLLNYLCFNLKGSPIGFGKEITIRFLQKKNMWIWMPFTICPEVHIGQKIVLDHI